MVSFQFESVTVIPIAMCQLSTQLFRENCTLKKKLMTSQNHHINNNLMFFLM